MVIIINNLSIILVYILENIYESAQPEKNAIIKHKYDIVFRPITFN